MSARRLPPLNSLRAFEVAARHQSFSRAAEELHLTAAAVSHHVREVESALQLALFERFSRGVRLTRVGEGYRDEVARLLTALERATEALNPGALEGPLRLSLPQSFAQRWLAPRLSGLLQRNPELQLEVVGDNRRVDLRAGEADLAIRFGPGDEPGLKVSHLIHDAVSVLVAADYPQALQPGALKMLLQNAPLLEDSWVGPAEPWMQWAPWLRADGVQRQASQGRIRFSDSALAISACQAGAGLCLGRMSLAYDLLRSRQLIALLPWRSSEFSYYLLARETDQDRPLLQAFQRWLQGELQQFAQAVLALTGVELQASTGG